MSNYKNILIVRTDRVGDIVLTTPAIAVLRRAYPRARLTILIRPAMRDLVEGNPHIDEIMTDDPKGMHKGFWGYARLVKEVRRKKFDLAVIFHVKRRTNLLCFLAGIPERIGYYNDKLGVLLTKKVPDARNLGLKHELQYCLDVLKYLNIDTGGTKEYVPLHDNSEEWAEQFLKKNHIDHSKPLVAVHSGAGDSSRKWPAEQFAQVIDFLSEKYSAHIVLVGDRTNQETVDKIMPLVKCPPFDLTGKTTLSQLASLLKRCRLLVSNESGPVHIADALDVPVLSIFTRNQPGINPKRWKPLGPRAGFISVKTDTSISFAKANQVDPKTLEPIPTQEVLEAVDGLLRL